MGTQQNLKEIYLETQANIEELFDSATMSR